MNIICKDAFPKITNAISAINLNKTIKIFNILFSFKFKIYIQHFGQVILAIFSYGKNSKISPQCLQDIFIKSPPNFGDVRLCKKP